MQNSSVVLDVALDKCKHRPRDLSEFEIGLLFQRDPFLVRAAIARSAQHARAEMLGLSQTRATTRVVVRLSPKKDSL